MARALLAWAINSVRNLQYGPRTRLVRGIIIWQDSLEVNPSVLIGSFLVGILPYGPFPWKRSMLCIFLVFESRAGKFKLRKENVQILSSSQRNYLKD